MGARVEIERKYLVAGEPWRAAGPGTVLRQGYLAREGPISVRIRVSPERAWLTLKGPTMGLSREEFEYPIPRADAELLLESCIGFIVDKVRYRLRVGDHVWEIDVFTGRNSGLVVAEIELEHEDEPFVRPEWLRAEVSFDERYRNSALANRPYSTWED